MMEDEQLILLISQPRSGSTLLQKLLGAHSEIYTRSEPWLMLHPLYSLKKGGVEAEYNHDLGREGLEEFCNGISDGKNKYIHELKNMYLNLYSYHMKNGDSRYFLDKTPRYYFIINELKEVFPNAKFILLIRNPLAVLGSIINTWTKDDWIDLIKYKYDLFDAIDKYIEVIDGKKNINIVHYEDLILNTEKELANIFNYLNIEFENVSRKYYETEERWKFGDQESVYSKKGLDRDSTTGWQKNLDHLQYWRVMYDYLDHIGKERFEKIGYNFEENKSTLIRKMPHNSLKYIFSNTKSLTSLLNQKDKIKEIKLRKELEFLKKELSSIHSSQEWRLVLILRKIFKTIFPDISLRKKIVIISLKSAKSSIGNIMDKILFLKDIINRSIKPIKKREINLESKKIVYVGHSYHSKTKSTAFLIDYLKKFYEVEVILDDSWQGRGQPYPNLSFIDESYLGVIFFQSLPDPDTLKKVRNGNCIFFPMYDGVSHSYNFWNKYRNLKIVNFSTTLHKKLLKWRFESMALQYFPKPQKFFPGENNSVFFWQRLTNININILEKLFRKDNLRIHFHKAIDPGHKFTEPNREQGEKFSITYSEWFDTREEMQEIIKQKGIYVAPREFEGIGMSFLEAMAMGKAVVAVDHPTMNEYIEHEKTGYLFDLKNPKKIDFSNIEQVQKNTYDYMNAGYEKWESEKHKIVDFIEKA